MWNLPSKNEQTLDAVTADKMCHSSPVCGSNVAELTSVGQVEISDEATLEDLKTQVEYVETKYIYIYILINVLQVGHKYACICDFDSTALLEISVSGVDTACSPKCVCTNHNIHAYVAVRRTEAGTNPQRTTTHTQV